MRRRNGSAYNSLFGSSSGTRNRPIAPGESGPCCQDSPINLPPNKADEPQSQTPRIFAELKGYTLSGNSVNQYLRSHVMITKDILFQENERLGKAFPPDCSSKTRDK